MIKIQKSRVQAGFTIVELMVGLVIGLIASLVIMQTFSTFEGNKRSTTGISDAQTSGSIGLYMLQRELQFAGYGIPLVSGTMPSITVPADQRTFANYTNKTQAEIDALVAAAKAQYTAQLATDQATVQAGEVYSALKCNPAPLMNMDADNNPLTPDIPVDIITPVKIIDGVTNGTGSDSVAAHYNSTGRGAMPTNISSVSGTDYVAVKNNMGCRQNDLVLVTRNSNTGDTSCLATRVTSQNSPVDKNQLRQTAAAADSPIAIYVTSNAGMAPQNKLACLGNHVVTTFDVVGTQLRKNSVPVLDEIVSLQAQYGISPTANSEIVDSSIAGSWVNATGATWANPTVANRNRIKAIRIAVVARNNLLEKNVVSQTCNGGAAGPAEICIWKNTSDETGVDLTTIPNWNRYRYRVYEVVVPLRNMLAASPQL
jgi:type IV pilus assembly protein PilW